MNENIICPFCNEDGFDLIGLKIHLIRYCSMYEETPLADHIHEYERRADGFLICKCGMMKIPDKHA
jgi:hypothetical protein